MDILLILQIIVLLGAIFLGVRLGGIGIGFAGGLGVVVLTLVLGMKVGNIPWDVILIIMSVIAAISAMQLAGGLDYLVQVAEKVLRSNPKYINYLAPTVTYVLTLLAGTGHTAFSMIPVIVEVAKEQNIKPSAPLSVAVVSSQIAITASPVSAAVVYMTGVLEPLGWSYPLLLGIWIPTTFIACMLTAFIISKFTNLDLSKDEVYQERLKNGLIKASTGAIHTEVKQGAKLSVLIFLLGVLCVVFYATTISDVVRKPMLNYVNSYIPTYIDKELDKAKQEALATIKDDKLRLNTQEAIASVLDEPKDLFIRSEQALKAKDSQAMMSLKQALNTAEAKITQIASQENVKALELIQTKLSALNANFDPILNEYIEKDSALASIASFVKSYIDPIRLPRDGAIMSFMLSIAALIVIFCKINTAKIFEQSVFKSGMVACVCVLGVAWLGDTFVAGYKGEIQGIAGDLATKLPFLVAVAFFFASMLLYSQAATAKAIVPTIIAALSITATSDGSIAANSYILVASFAAVSALFVLPTYPTLLGAVQMDDTGSTRIGKYVFNHAFLIPGTLAIALSVALGFLIAPLF